MKKSKMLAHISNRTSMSMEGVIFLVLSNDPLTKPA